MWRRWPVLGRFLARRKAPLTLRHADIVVHRGGRVFADWHGQRQHLLDLAGHAVAIVRVGRNVELLRRRDCKRCGAGAPAARWPYARLPVEHCAWAALARRHRVLLVGQLPGYHRRPRARAPIWLIEPLDAYLGWQRQFGAAAAATPVYARSRQPAVVARRRNQQIRVSQAGLASAGTLAVVGTEPPPCTPGGQYYLPFWA
jgi:hypothetical protein